MSVRVNYFQMFRKSFELYKKNPIVLLPYIILNCMYFVIQVLPQYGYELFFWALLPVFVVFSILVGCGLLGMFYEATRKRTDMNTFWKTIRKRALSYVGASILLSLVVVGGFILIIIMGVVLGMVSSLVALLFIILGFVYIFLSLFFLSFYMYGVVVDKKSAAESLALSYRIVRKNVWEVLKFYLFILLLSLFLISPPLIILAIISVFFKNLTQWLLAIFMIYSTLISPLFSFFTMLFYLRIRST
ncbi:MAG: hypothetical protein DRP11_03280 [Candidatus Aenigmatarchaeota archaeon]|nr:MAG: hypothetical protein DRP11_03280 [Candidatus Aenigmarchaeota archaeon]